MLTCMTSTCRDRTASLRARKKGFIILDYSEKTMPAAFLRRLSRRRKAWENGTLSSNSQDIILWRMVQIARRIRVFPHGESKGCRSWMDFFTRFDSSTVKLGTIEVLIEMQGEIRRSCRAPNKRTQSLSGDSFVIEPFVQEQLQSRVVVPQ
ncbi:hypothetical protein BHE74_00028615 [Ensete ventricosum]|nr:hypothetical protein BHE74_00028615 [Ensete ventricosum]